MARLSFSCVSCGYKWQGRTRTKGKRRCPKCSSRRIEEDGSDAKLIKETSTIEPVQTKQGHSPFTYSGTPPNDIRDDPEVRKKLKELEIARIDTEIMKLKGEQQETSALPRTVNWIKGLIDYLNGAEIVTNDFWEELDSFCPWCGKDVGHREFIRPGVRGWRCHNCGRTLV